MKRHYRTKNALTTYAKGGTTPLPVWSATHILFCGPGLMLYMVCRHFVPRYRSLGSDASSHRAGEVTAVVEPIDARVAQCKNCHNLSA